MSDERWLPVPGYEGLYEVSDHGQVRSLHTHGRGKRGALLKPMIDSHGYPRVALWRNKVQVGRRIHRLVALAFTGPQPEGQEIRHLDGNKLNNTLANLAYGTHQENLLDRVRHGTHQHAAKTHCVNSHEFTEENTRRDGNTRKCRACLRRANVEYRRRKREAEAAA